MVGFGMPHPQQPSYEMPHPQQPSYEMPHPQQPSYEMPHPQQPSYDSIDEVNGEFCAVRRDHPSVMLRAGTVGELREKIIADYAAKPVP